MTAGLDRVLGAFGARQAGDGWSAKCPAHEDRNASLSLAAGRNGGVVVKCHAGCPVEDVVAAVGLSMLALAPEAAPRPARRRQVATYPYLDEAGEVLFEAVRYDPKDFRQRHPNGNGGWTWNLNGCRRVLYKLPEVLEGVAAARRVFIAEGEKDCDALVRAGEVATCGPMGAGKWGQVAELATEVLAGAEVIVVADKDTAGRKHAAEVVASLTPVAASVVVVEAATGKDAADHLGAGRTVDDLEVIDLAAADRDGGGGGDAHHPDGGDEHHDHEQEKVKTSVAVGPVDANGHGPVVGVDPPSWDGTDTANAERFVADHAGTARWCGPWGAWLVWDGTRWRRDVRDQVVELAKGTARCLAQETADTEPPDETDAERRKRMAKAAGYQNIGRIRAMLELARSHPAIAIVPDDLDADAWALNVRNGTLDLRTGRLHPHRPGDLLTKQAAASYHPEAEAPTWSAFLTRVLPDIDVRTFVQRSLGYASTGIVAESLLWLAYGGGANGKTTLLGTIEVVLGDHAGPAAPDLLLAGRDQHPTGMADLKGARLVLTSELDDGRRLAEATVKQLTGGDVIKARVMRGDFFSFTPTHHLWIQTNHRPGIRGTDTGIWRRLRLVPFEVTVPPSEQDPRLGEKLRAEADGILTWLVQGCLDWQQHGLTEPLAVRLATADYRAEEDALGTFLTDCCIEQEQATVSAADLYDAYKAWSTANGEDHLNQRRFGQQLTERNLERRKHGPQRRWSWFGLGLIGADQQQLDVNP